jgi:hypothetical protein
MKLLSVAQSEIVHTLLEGTSCRDLVRELGRSLPVDSNELFDIATSFASDKEEVGAIFDEKKGKRVDDAPAKGSKSKKPQQKHKQGKKGKKPHREVREQGRDDDGDEALAVDPARRGHRAAPRGPGVFDDMLKKPCPYHKTPVNHTLEQCDLLKRYYSHAATKDGEAKKDGGDGDAGGLPAVENVFLIFGGPTVDMSNSQHKREWHEVFAAEKAPPSFLDCSEDAITFSREDHPNRIPNPGQYPLVVDPVIENSRFSKVLMDGGSSLNILYAHTLCLLGIGLDQLRPSTMPFNGVAPGKHVQPLGQIGLPLWFGTPDNFRKETLTFEVVELRGASSSATSTRAYVVTTRRRAPSWATRSARASTGPPRLRMPARSCAPAKGACSTPANPTFLHTSCRPSPSHGLSPCGGWTSSGPCGKPPGATPTYWLPSTSFLSGLRCAPS